MNISLRAPLVGLWLLIVAVCLALAFLMAGVFELGVGGEIKRAQSEVEKSRDSIRQRFASYLSGFEKAPAAFDDAERRRELNVIVDLVLNDFKGVEGGFWNERAGFVAYGFPTYEGGTAKRDAPEAEAQRIAGVCRAALENNRTREQRFDGAREVLILSAQPAEADGMAIWTMSRAHVSAAAAYQKLTVGFAALFVFALVSGGGLLWFLQRWSRRVTALEETIATAPPDELPALPQTGQKELDRIVGALNHLNNRLKQTREESEKLNKNLARAERTAALGRMAAGLAHEIRNPIAAMRLRAENALAKSDEHRAGALEFILQEIRRLDDLLQRLLTVARLDELDRKLVALRPWLAARVENIREQAAEKRAELEAHAPDATGNFDEKSMSRALDNLLLNALQHTPEGGWIKTRAEVRDDRCVIAVENSGPQIAPEKREEIFEPFTTTRDGGTGLGLSIAREIAEAHGGSLRCVESGAGARFEIELPCQKS